MPILIHHYRCGRHIFWRWRHQYTSHPQMLSTGYWGLYDSFLWTWVSLSLCPKWPHCVTSKATLEAVTQLPPNAVSLSGCSVFNLAITMQGSPNSARWREHLERLILKRTEATPRHQPTATTNSQTWVSLLRFLPPTFSPSQLTLSGADSSLPPQILFASQIWELNKMLMS